MHCPEVSWKASLLSQGINRPPDTGLLLAALPRENIRALFFGFGTCFNAFKAAGFNGIFWLWPLSWHLCPRARLFLQSAFRFCVRKYNKFFQAFRFRLLFP
jgi:hypothetical protein